MLWSEIIVKTEDDFPKKMCICCLSSEDSLTPTLSLSRLEEVSVSCVYKQVTGLASSEDNNAPDVACAKCVENLVNLYKFKEMCTKNRTTIEQQRKGHFKEMLTTRDECEVVKSESPEPNEDYTMLKPNSHKNVTNQPFSKDYQPSLGETPEVSTSNLKMEPERCIDIEEEEKLTNNMLIELHEVKVESNETQLSPVSVIKSMKLRECMRIKPVCYESSKQGNKIKCNKIEQHFQCKFCNFKSTQLQNAFLHIEENTNNIDKITKCHTCSLDGFPSYCNLKQHFSAHQTDLKRYYGCHYCVMLFSDSRSLKHHCDEHHREFVYLCEICGTYGCVEHHQFICADCTATFGTSEGLYSHREQKHLASVLKENFSARFRLKLNNL